jgi:streptomycin 6-kinase
MKIPKGMDWRRGAPGGPEWLDRLPSLAEECAGQWSLMLGEPFAGSNLSLVLPAERADGTRAVLKMSFPGDVGNREADALAHWAGRGAVLLLAHDPGRRALLLERCEPGKALALLESEDELLRTASELLRGLWTRPPAEHGFASLAEELGPWADELQAQWLSLGRPFERALIEEAVVAVRELTAVRDDEVVLHGDFHSGNVLMAQREPWLAIDPIPLVGERAFDAASLLRDTRWEVATESLRRRIDVLADELGLDHDRLRRWGIVHALWWGVSWAKLEYDMVLVARLLRS